MHRHLLVASLALVGGIAAPADVDACARPRISEELVTPDGATLASDGGLITETRFNDMSGGGDDELGDRGRRFEAHAPGGALLPTTGQYIAPMLSVLRVTAPTTTVDVFRGKTRIRSFTVAKSAALPAPRLARVTSTLSATASTVVTKEKMGGPNGEVSYTFAGDAPADAYALVLLQINSPGSVGVAWARPSAKVKTFSYPFGGKSCTGGFPGLRRGDRVAAAWLDVHGRLSKPSATIVVGAPQKATTPATPAKAATP